MFICLIKFVLKVFVNTLRSTIRLAVTILCIAGMLLYSGCSAQKLHKAVPCPCEKKRR
jgi:hypothetical protein